MSEAVPMGGPRVGYSLDLDDSAKPVEIDPIRLNNLLAAGFPEVSYEAWSRVLIILCRGASPPLDGVQGRVTDIVAVNRYKKRDYSAIIAGENIDFLIQVCVQDNKPWHIMGSNVTLLHELKHVADFISPDKNLTSIDDQFKRIKKLESGMRLAALSLLVTAVCEVGTDQPNWLVIASAAGYLASLGAIKSIDRLSSDVSLDYHNEMEKRAYLAEMDFNMEDLLYDSDDIGIIWHPSEEH